MSASGTSRTFRDFSRESDIGGKADIDQPWPFSIYEYAGVANVGFLFFLRQRQCECEALGELPHATQFSDADKTPGPPATARRGGDPPGGNLPL